MLNDHQTVEQKAAAAVGFIDLTASLAAPPSQPFFFLLPSSL